MPPTAAELQAGRQGASCLYALMAKWAALKARVNGPAVAAGSGGGK